MKEHMTMSGDCQSCYYTSVEKAANGIKDRFGSTAIVRVSSVGTAGQAQHRALKIGGHYK